MLKKMISIYANVTDFPDYSDKKKELSEYVTVRFSDDRAGIDSVLKSLKDQESIRIQIHLSCLRERNFIGETTIVEKVNEFLRGSKLNHLPFLDYLYGDWVLDLDQLMLLDVKLGYVKWLKGKITVNPKFQLHTGSEDAESYYRSLLGSISISAQDTIRYDLFLSYATEDKSDFVEPLVCALQNLNLRIWYDEFVLLPGDSLRRKINEGLLQSNMGLVVISRHFLEKDWPQYELDAMNTLFIEKNRRIIPVWHNITKEQIVDYSPFLADKVALISNEADPKAIAEKIKLMVRVN